MTWRRQLPVHSPLSLGALAGGLGSAVSGGGRARARVEAWIRERYAADRVLLTDSGTSALALAMQAAVRRSPGKPILLPSYSCYDLVTAAMAAGVEVGWYDIEPATLQPDWASLQAALKPGVAAVVVVHHYGIPADVSRVRGLAGGATVIEDAAQAIGGRLEGRPLGALGGFGVLSFGRGKGMTGGGGGALLSNTEEGGQLLDELRPSLGAARGSSGSLVSTAAQWMLARPSLYALPASLPFLQLGATVFRPPHRPREMSPVHAGVLARTLQYEEAEGEARQWHAARLRELAEDWSIPITGSQARGGYLRFPLLLPQQLAGLRETPEAGRLGIMPGYPVSLPLLPGSPFPPADAPGAKQLVARLATFPTHSRLNENGFGQIRRVLGAWRARAAQG